MCKSQHPGGMLESKILSTSLGHLLSAQKRKSNTMQKGKEGLRLLAGRGDLRSCFLSRCLWRAPAVLEVPYVHQSTRMDVSPPLAMLHLLFLG